MSKAKTAPSSKDEVDALVEDLGRGMKQKVAAQIADGPKFDDLDAAKDAEPEDRATSDDDMIGKTVVFEINGEKHSGKVLAPAKEDQYDVDVEGLDSVWTIPKEGLTIVEASPSSASEDEPVAEGDAPEDVLDAPKKEGVRKPKPEATSKDAGEVKLVKISDVKVPKTKIRELDKESDEYKLLAHSIKKHGLDQAILVTPKLVLLDGLGRLEILKDLGRTLVPVRFRDAKDDVDRIHQGLRANVAHRNMHWLDLARAAMVLVENDRFTQAEVAKEIGVAASDLSKMLAAVQLPKEMQKLARGDSYPRNTFLEYVSAPEAAQVKIRELMEAGSTVTTLDVREVAREARKAEDEAARYKGEEPPADNGHGGARDTRPKAMRDKPALSYRDLTTKELGEPIHARVYKDRIDLNFSISFEKNSFKGFDPIEAIKAAFDQAYSDGGSSICSHENLAEALGALRAELA